VGKKKEKEQKRKEERDSVKKGGKRKTETRTLMYQFGVKTGNESGHLV